MIRFPKFSIVRLHLYQGISARITPECSLAKIVKDDTFISQSVKWDKHEMLKTLETNKVYPQEEIKKICPMPLVF